MEILTQATRNRFVFILLAGVFWFLLAVSVSAQLPTGTFLGVVKDSSGAVVPGATVTVQSAETNETRNAVTNPGGAYRVPALPVGHYQIVVGHAGFKTETQTGLNLEVGQEAVVDFTLQVGTAEQTVQVTGEAQQVNTTNSTLGSVVGEQTMSDLPLNGRNYVDLTLLQPGITQHKQMSNTGGQAPGAIFSSNGAPIQSNFITIDGADMRSTYGTSAASGTGNTLGVDGIREYKVVTSNFSAEYGMTMGSQTVLVSKSGTNSFHGDAFEFIRNSVLDAANYFDVPTAGNNFERTPPFRRNNFGGAGGGPIQKNKTFFFGAYEALRENIGQTIQNGTLPANCFVATANPCATLSGGVVNPAAFQIIKLFPQPNLPGNQATYNYNEPLRDDWGQMRVDHTFSAKDTAFARFTIDDSFFSFGLGYKPFVQSEPTRGTFATISENHVFSSSLLNTARFSFSRTAEFITSPSDFGPNYPNLIVGQQVPGLGTFQISGVTATSYGSGFGPIANEPHRASLDVFTWSDDLFYEHGKHSFKFGTLINNFHEVANVSLNLRGAFNATSLASFLAGTLSQVQFTAYPDVSNFCNPPGCSATFRHFRYDTLGWYVQDDYKVLPNLTLNLGLRYEFATVAREGHGLETIGTPTCAFPCYQLGAEYKNPYLHNFSPRIGFAWDVFGNGKTSLRGGAALLYDVATLSNNFATFNTPPFSFSNNVSNVKFVTPLNFNLSGSQSFTNNTSTNIAYNLKAPKMYEWNLTVERQLPWSTALQLSYVGTRGIHLLQGADQNPTQFQIQNGQPFWPANAPRVVNPTWSFFSVVGTTDDSWYHGLEVTATKRVSRGLQFQSAYTYSKMIDITDGVRPSEDTGTINTPVTLLDPGLDRGLASYDNRNNYRFNMVYNLPTTSSAHDWVKTMLNGWRTAAILSAQNGFPFTPAISNNRSRSATSSSNPSGLDRPDWAPGRNPYNTTHGGSSGCTEGSGATAVVIPAGTPLGGPNLYFDPCAFILEPVGYEGNVRRNSLIGPGLLDLDYSLIKDTSVKWLGEAGKVEFRAEFFNILNHPNFAQPQRTVFSGTSTAACPITGCPAGTENPLTQVGLIQSTATGTTATQASGNSRQIQFGLKIMF